MNETRSENREKKEQLSKNERIRLHNEKEKKNKRRKNAVSITAVIIAAFTLIILLSFFVLFKTKEIKITGDTRYSEEQIIAVSEIKLDKGILLISKKDTSDKIKYSLPYIGKVQIKKQLSGVVLITVEETKAEYAMNTGSGFLLFDSGGKILETASAEIPAGCALVTGFTAENAVPGVNINTAASEGYINFAQLAAKCREAGISGITSYDVTDEYNISFVFDSRLTVKLGNADNLKDKLLTANEVINRENSANPDKSAIIDISSGKKAFVRNFEHTTVPETVLPDPDIDEPTDSDSDADGDTDDTTKISADG